MANNFSGLIGKFIVSAIIITSLLVFVISVQRDNEAPQKIIDNPVFNDSFSSLSNQIVNSTATSQGEYSSFNSEQPKEGFGSILMFGIVSVGKSYSQITLGFFAAMIKLPLIVLGIDPSIYNLILTYLIITIIVAVWLLYKLGG